MSVPAKMKTPTKGSASTQYQIQVLWQELTTIEETGGTMDITSYGLEMFGPT